MMLEFEVTELHRRLANLIQLGCIVETDYFSAIPRVRVEIGKLLTAWLPILTQRAGLDRSWWPMDIGEQVMILAPSGDLAQGIVLGSINQQAFPAIAQTSDVHRIQYSDGAVIEYNHTSHYLKAILPSSAKTKLISDGGIEITGDLTIKGNLVVNGDISDQHHSMQADRNIYNAHTHAGVQPGAGITATPQPTQ